MRGGSPFIRGRIKLFRIIQHVCEESCRILCRISETIEQVFPSVTLKGVMLTKRQEL